MLEEIYLDFTDKKKMLSIARALANEARINILALLNESSLSVNEIARQLDLPISTAAFHVNILEQAGLLATESKPGIRGAMKVSFRSCDRIVVKMHLDQMEKKKEQSIVLNMPVGNYANCEIYPSCGIVNEKSAIGIFDQPCSFYLPEHTSAQLLWFYKGFVEYRFPNTVLTGGMLKRLDLSFEACGEVPFHHNGWPSDITVWINDVEVGTWTGPGELEGRRGKFNPSWWPGSLNQYGLLKSWVVSPEGAFLDADELSSIVIDDLHINDQYYISVKIGIKKDARNIGGVSLFGEHFGDYSQNIVLKLDYELA